MMDSLKLNEDLTVEFFEYSEFITCVEVFFRGQNYSSFCSLKDQVQEWREDTEELISICIKHINDN